MQATGSEANSFTCYAFHCVGWLDVTVICWTQQAAVEDVSDAPEVMVGALVVDMDGVIPEEPQEFRHATSLDRALQHLIPTLQSNKGNLSCRWITVGIHLHQGPVVQSPIKLILG